MKKLSITAIIEKSPEGWYVGQLEEFPEVISQGKSIEELKDNLMDALSLVMAEQREKTKEEYKGKKTIRRKMSFA